MSKLNRAQNRLVQEIGALVVVVLLVIGVVIFRQGGLNQAPKVAPAVRITTTFDEDTLQTVKAKDNNYPVIVPNNIGKPDPFN